LIARTVLVRISVEWVGITVVLPFSEADGGLEGDSAV
jgi:hypothetical protein